MMRGSSVVALRYGKAFLGGREKKLQSCCYRRQLHPTTLACAIRTLRLFLLFSDDIFYTPTGATHTLHKNHCIRAHSDNMSDAQLFEDTFTITSINSQKYDRVSRISCTSTDNLTTFTLDVNTELYPCTVGESVSLALASTLSLDGKDEDSAAGRGGWRDVGMGENTLANEYDYVCHGKVYRFEEGSTQGNMYENSFLRFAYH